MTIERGSIVRGTEKVTVPPVLVEAKQWMRGPLSKDGEFVLFVVGPFGTREIQNLIKQLELTAEWFAEDESAQSDGECPDDR